MKCGRRWIGTCSPTRRGAGPGRRASGRGGISLGFRAGPLTHQSHAGMGILAAGRHPRRAPGCLPAPAAARCGEHGHRAGRPSGGHLDSGPASPACSAGAARLGQVGRPPRWVGGGFHRPPGRGSGVTGTPAPGRRTVGAPVSFPGRPERVAQDRRRARAGPPKHPAAGATTPICSSSAAAVSPAARAALAAKMPTKPTCRSGGRPVQPVGRVVLQ